MKKKEIKFQLKQAKELNEGKVDHGTTAYEDASAYTVLLDLYLKTDVETMNFMCEEIEKNISKYYKHL